MLVKQNLVLWPLFVLKDGPRTKFNHCFSSSFLSVQECVLLSLLHSIRPLRHFKTGLRTHSFVHMYSFSEKITEIFSNFLASEHRLSLYFAAISQSIISLIQYTYLMKIR